MRNEAKNKPRVGAGYEAGTCPMPPGKTPGMAAASVEDRLKAIDTARVDRRTRTARQLEATTRALESNPQEALKALLRGCLATGVLLQNEVLTAAQQKDLVTDEGRLPDILSKDLLKVQRNLTSVANLLGQLEGCFAARKAPVVGKPKPGATVASLILADDDGGEDEDRD